MNQWWTRYFSALAVGLLAGAGTGFFAGYLYFSEPTMLESEPGTSGTQPRVPALRETSAEARLETAVAAGDFILLETEAIRLLARGNFGGAVEKLLEADLFVETPADEAQLALLLEEAVRLQVEKLRDRGRLDEIDQLYEHLTLSMPERADYYLLLAEHRIETGYAELALPVLAQIENHHQLGERARELIDAISRPEIPGPVAVIPLERSGDQFLVTARLDGAESVRLLIDTGASVTVVHPLVLDRLGYNLSRSPQGRFLTAGGAVDAPIINIDTLELGGQGLANLSIGALSISISRGVDGLLGMDFLSRFRFRVDQDAAQLILDSRR